MLLDLSRPGEDELRALAGPAAAVLALLLMREVRRRVPDVLGVLERAAQLLGSLSASDRSGTFVALVIYSQATTLVGRKPLCDLAEAIMGEQGAQQFMTTAEQLMAEGGVEAARRILLRLIKQQLQVESLPRDALERIDSASLSELETWTGRVIGASSLDEILTGP